MSAHLEGNVLCVKPMKMTPYEDEFIVGKRYDADINFLGQFHVRGESGQLCGIWKPFFIESFGDAKDGYLLAVENTGETEC